MWPKDRFVKDSQAYNKNGGSFILSSRQNKE